MRLLKKSIPVSLRGAAGDAAISKKGLLRPCGAHNDNHYKKLCQKRNF